MLWAVYIANRIQGLMHRIGRLTDRTVASRQEQIADDHLQLKQEIWRLMP